jgi:hypothetical protein
MISKARTAFGSLEIVGSQTWCDAYYTIVLQKFTGFSDGRVLGRIVS